MKKYLSVVKDDEVDAIFPFSLNEKKEWPSYLNSSVARGKEYWVDLINGSNYFLTAQQYTDLKYFKYAEWLMEVNFTDKSLILGDFAQYSEDANFMYNFEKDYRKNVKYVLRRSIVGDNVKVLEEILALEKFSDGTMFEIMYAAMEEKAKRCLHLILTKYVTFIPTQQLGDKVWALLSRYNDHDVVISLQRFLDVTYLDKEWLGTNTRDLMFGEDECLKERLGKCSTMRYVGSLVSRLPSDERAKTIFFSFLSGKNHFSRQPWLDHIVTSVVSSRRRTEDTLEIIASFKYADISFFPTCRVDLQSITLQSWPAVMSTNFLDFAKAKMEKGKMDITLFYKQNRVLLNEILHHICPALPPPCLTKLFSVLGTSLTKWAYEEGLLKNICCREELLLSVCRSGNVFLLALMLEKRTVGKIQLDHKFYGGELFNQECIPFIKCCSGRSAEEKERFFGDSFGNSFYDTSLVANNAQYNKKLDTVFRVLQMDEMDFDELTPDPKKRKLF